jgi:hypothetical protein
LDSLHPGLPSDSSFYMQTNVQTPEDRNGDTESGEKLDVRAGGRRLPQAAARLNAGQFPDSRRFRSSPAPG